MGSTNQQVDLYAGLGGHGEGMTPLRRAFQLMRSPLEKQVPERSAASWLQKDHRFSQVNCFSPKSPIGYDLWDHGVYLGRADRSDPLEVARSLHAWIEEKTSISEMRTSFPFITFEPIADSFEKGVEIEWKWQTLELSIRSGEHFASLLPLVVAARKREELKLLFPFTSLTRLCFSRCTGFPFTGDCPHAVPTKEGEYQVNDASGREVGTGDAESAVDMLIENLPQYCGRAKKGTADDMKNDQCLIAIDPRWLTSTVVDLAKVDVQNLRRRAPPS